jgi:N-acetylmuramoyl-L-alanine amidase
MKLTWYLFAMVLVAGGLGLGLKARPLVPQDLESPVQPAIMAESVSQPGASGSEAADSTEASQAQEDTPIRPRESGRSRWGRANRYPGPIPTPEEWEPPEGPVRIGLQAGHWKANEAPSELSGIRDNGTRWGDMFEWEVNLKIAQEAGEQLKALGYEVDLLPAVVPPSYRAHLFISIHADGSNDSRASGFRVAAPRRDASGRASGFVKLLKEHYGKETELRALPDVTHRMQNYYAFNFRRYEHALHPMTIGVILETGFLTSARDRRVIMDDPARVAKAIVEAVTAFPETPPPEMAVSGGG